MDEILSKIDEYKNILIENENTLDLYKIEKSKIDLFTSIINYIKITYDMDFIDYAFDILEIDIRYKIELIEYIEQNISSIFNNIVLEKLFNNYKLNEEKKIYELNITGPMSYRHYYNHLFNKLGEVNIHLFGEYHFGPNRCDFEHMNKQHVLNIDFINYLDIILQNSSSFIDLYIEDTMNNSKLHNISTYHDEDVLKTIYDLSIKYEKCNKLIPRNDDCNLFRFHYIDIRREINENTMEYDFNNLISSMFTFISYTIENNNFPFGLFDLYNIVKDKTKKIYNDNIYNFFYKDIFNKILLKQLSKSFLKDEIIDFIIDEIKIHIDTIKDEFLYNINSLNDFFNTYSNIYDIGNNFILLLELKSILKNIKLLLIDLYTNKMDAYGLSRIFRDFNVELNINQPKNVRTIYIYAGDYHCKQYSKFIEKSLGFKYINKDYVVHNSELSCINANILLSSNIIDKIEIFSYKESPKTNLHEEIFIEDEIDEDGNIWE